MRDYTPISPVTQLGTFDLLIKVYRRNVHPKFPNGGVLTQHLETLQVGDKIKVAGPVSKFFYEKNGLFKMGSMTSFKVKNVGLICGGSGIAVMYPIIKAILDNREDPTMISLLYANKTIDDIVFKEELDALAADPRLTVYYTLDVAPENWQGFTGYVTKEMIRQTMPLPGKDTFMWVSGPDVMDVMVGRQLGEMGYSGERKFATRGWFYWNVFISTVLGFLKRVFTFQCFRKKRE